MYRRDIGEKEAQECSQLDVINTETEMNLLDTTGLCCKLQQALVHLHQVIEEGVTPYKHTAVRLISAGNFVN